MSVKLAATEFGTGSPILILHGLFGSGTNWRSIAQKLAATRHVFTLDIRNHGVSPWANEMSYGAMAEDVAAFVESRGLGTVDLVGHSMGGKAAMALALTAPQIVSRLVVVDVAPVDYPPSLLGYIRAMRAIDPSPLASRSEADDRLKTSIPEAAIRAFLLQNLAAGEDGRLRWRINLAVLERTLPEISGWTMQPGASPYRGPTLFIAGALSDYIRPAHEAEIVRLFPSARIASIAGAGHWVHAERPDAFLAELTSFLDA